MRLALALLSVFTLTSFALMGCDTVPPPVEPTPTPIIPEPDPDARPIAIAQQTDVSTLRPMCERQRERLRVLIDLAERREIDEGGPRMLRVAKEHSRVLDRIEARIDEAMRMGTDSGDADELHDELVRFSSRLDSLAVVLR